MSVKAISRKFGLGIDNWECSNIELPENTIIQLNGTGKTDQEIVAEAILKTYPIMEDNNRLKFSPLTFEKQRGDYPVRREFPVYTIQKVNISSEALQMLKNLGFQF